MPHVRSLIPNLCLGATRKIWDFDLRLGGCRICASEIYFLIFLENNEGKRLKWPSTWFCDSTKARELLHMEPEYFVHHIWSRFWGLSTSQPRSKWKYLKDYSTYLKEGPEATRRMFWLLEVLEDAQPSTRRQQDSVTKSSGACQTRGSGTAYRHIVF